MRIWRCVIGQAHLPHLNLQLSMEDKYETETLRWIRAICGRPVYKSGGWFMLSSPAKAFIHNLYTITAQLAGLSGLLPWWQSTRCSCLSRPDLPSIHLFPAVRGAPSSFTFFSLFLFVCCTGPRRISPPPHAPNQGLEGHLIGFHHPGWPSKHNLRGLSPLLHFSIGASALTWILKPKIDLNTAENTKDVPHGCVCYIKSKCFKTIMLY